MQIVWYNILSGVRFGPSCPEVLSWLQNGRVWIQIRLAGDLHYYFSKYKEKVKKIAFSVK